MPTPQKTRSPAPQLLTVREQLVATLALSPTPLRAIARATRIDVSTLSKARRGLRPLSAEAVDALAVHFGLILTPATPATTNPNPQSALPPPTKRVPRYRQLAAIARAVTNASATKNQSTTKSPTTQSGRKISK